MASNYAFCYSSELFVYYSVPLWRGRQDIHSPPLTWKLENKDVVRGQLIKQSSPEPIDDRRVASRVPIFVAKWGRTKQHDWNMKWTFV